MISIIYFLTTLLAPGDGGQAIIGGCDTASPDARERCMCYCNVEREQNMKEKASNIEQRFRACTARCMKIKPGTPAEK